MGGDADSRRAGLDEGAKQIAREIQTNLGMEPMEDPFIDEMSRLIDPEKAEQFCATICRRRS